MAATQLEESTLHFLLRLLGNNYCLPKIYVGFGDRRLRAKNTAQSNTGIILTLQTLWRHSVVTGW